MSLKSGAPRTKKWPRYCFYAAVVLLLIAVIIYVIYCQSINSEFGYAEAFYGDRFDELYALSEIDEDIFDPIVKQGRKALEFIGTEEECAAYGVLSRYCTDMQTYPEAHNAKVSIDAIAAATEGRTGYLWVAYTQNIYDAQGTLICESGSEDQRILSRWTVEKIDGVWTVTEVSEP